MSQKIINVGNAPDDGTGDPLRTSMQKVNDNFTEFYTAITPTGKNVGIGTTTPESRLTVVADTPGTAVRITQTGTGNALVVEDSTNPDVTSFVINKDGNVGINKNLPTFPLDVNGDINTSGKLRFNTSTKYIGFENGVYNLPGADLTINNSKAITVSNFNTYAPTLTGSGASGLWNITVADATYSTGSRANTFTIGTGSTFVANGNFGINKTTPQAKLHVGGDAIVNNSLIVNGYMIVGNSQSVSTSIQGISNTWHGIQGVSNSGIGVVGESNTSYGVLGLSNTGWAGYFISTNGPGVYGESQGNYYGVFGLSKTTVGVAGHSNSWVGVWGYSNVSYGVYAQSKSGPPLWVGNGAVEFVSVTAAGNLGVANSTPSHKLSVNGPSYFGSSIQLNGPLLVGSGTGSTGTLGQVLTSSGTTGAPTWTTISSGGGGGGGGDTYYNTFPEGDGQLHSQIFTSSSTWTAPDGVARVRAYVVGGGAGGGWGFWDGENAVSGLPGGSGGFAYGEYVVVPGTVYNITVGQGGHGNTTTNPLGGTNPATDGAGAPGGTSSFDTFCSASGGTGTPYGATQGYASVVNGTGTGGNLRNFNGSVIFSGGDRPVSFDSSVANHIAWNIDAIYGPGIGGLPHAGSSFNWNDNPIAQGGVDGIVYLEWVEAAKGFQTANVQTFDTSGTWHKPDGLQDNSMVFIQAWGAGGGGDALAGGGGGGYNERWVALSTLSSTETVTVGTGGTGGNGYDIGYGYSGTAAIDGGDTSFGSKVYAYGGGKGRGGYTAGGGGGQLSKGGSGDSFWGSGYQYVNPGKPYIQGKSSQFHGQGGSQSYNENGLEQYIGHDGFWHGGGGSIASGSSQKGGDSVFGGAGGAGGFGSVGGVSSHGGNGGGVGHLDGYSPGGGGSAGAHDMTYGTGGTGGNGRVIVTIFGAGTTSGTSSSKITRMTEQSLAGVASREFTGIPYWAKRVTVLLDNVDAGVIQGNVLIQLGNSNGTYKTSGYTNIGTIGSSSNAAFMAVYPGLLSGKIVFENIYGNVWVFNGQHIIDVSPADGLISSGRVDIGFLLERIKVSIVNNYGGFVTGVANVMYE